MRDPYAVLGVPRRATSAEIKDAYRRLVKQLHPDLHPSDRAVEQRFKDVTAAYGLLGDDARRARYDRGDIGADGRPRARPAAARAEAGPAGPRSSEGRGFFDDLFAWRSPRARGADVSYTLTVGFVEAARGARERLALEDGRVVEVVVPPGTRPDDTLRLKGQGRPGQGGDALVRIAVAPHPHFTARDRDVHLDLPVTLPEAVLGAAVEVPTIDGPVALKVPAGSSTGTVLRLKGRGIPDRRGRGDQYVRLLIMLPDPPDDELKRFVESWRPAGAYEPRRKMGSG